MTVLFELCPIPIQFSAVDRSRDARMKLSVGHLMVS
jgi:hypothetical protein